MKATRSIVFSITSLMPRKPDAVFQERGYHYFIGSIDDTGHIPSAVHRFVGECQVAEPFRIGLLKRQIRALGEIEPVERRA